MVQVEKLEVLIKEAKRIGKVILDFPGTFRLVSHHDADGIAAASIMVETLLREGKSFHLSFVKQLTEGEIIRLSGEDQYKFIIFTDLGSGQLENIQKHLGENTVVVLDHHEVQGTIKEENRDSLLHLNPMSFGITENVSGSGITYILSRAVSPGNRDLSQLGIIGAIGDSQTGSIAENWGVAGLNREILKDAEKTGKIKTETGLRIWGKYTRPVHKALEYSVDPYIPGISGSESGAVQFLQELGIKLKKDNGKWRTLADLSLEEQKKLATGIIKERIRNGEENPEWIFGDVYELLDKEGEFKDAGEFATILNACGKLDSGYLGVALCLNDKNAFEEAKDVFRKYRKEIGKAINWVFNNKQYIRETEHGIYVLAGKHIKDSLLSNVVSIINHSGEFSKKPIFAFAETKEGGIKLSARADDSLLGKGLNLKEIIVDILKETGGEGGGHSGAAGAFISKESIDKFIEVSDSILSKFSEKENKKDLNTPEQENTINCLGEKYGTTESERSGEKGREEIKGESRTSTDKGKKMEGEGLVRYIGS